MGHCVDDPEARGILNLCPEDKLVGGFNMFQYVSICFNMFQSSSIFKTYLG